MSTNQHIFIMYMYTVYTSDPETGTVACRPVLNLELPIQAVRFPWEEQ
jgi:hypothetical protein